MVNEYACGGIISGRKVLVGETSEVDFVKLCPSVKASMTDREREKLAWLRARIPGCPNIYAVPGFIPNGCGSDSLRSKIIRRILNDPFGLADVEAAGDYHDYLYWRGGIESDREKADVIIMDLMRSACPLSWRPSSWVKWWAMRRVSLLYFIAVRAGGHEHFEYKPIRL